MFSLPLLFISLTKAASYTYPDEGYCSRYTKSISDGGFNFDKTQIPNPPISSYLNGLSTLDSTILLNEIKLDQWCVQQADLENLYHRIVDQSRREQILEEIESLIANQTKTSESLRILTEKAERISKILETFKSTSAPSLNDVLKDIIDERSKIHETIINDLSEFNDQKNLFIKDIESTLAPRLLEFESLLDDPDSFNQKKDQLFSKLHLSFQPIKTHINLLVDNLNSSVTTSLESVFSEEKKAFMRAARSEYSDNEEYQAVVNAFDTLLLERKSTYFSLVDQILNTTKYKYESFLNLIESVIGNSNVSRAHLLASTTEVLKEFDYNIKDAMVFDVDSFVMDIDDDVSDLISLVYTTDFQLAALLDMEPAQLRLIIMQIHNNDYSGLTTQVDSLHNDTKNKLSSIIQTQDDEINKEYQSLELGELILSSELSDNDLKLLENSDFPEDVKALILEIARAYGGYIDYLLDYFSYYSGELLVGKVKDFHAKALGVINILDSTYSTFSLEPSSEQFLKFVLLSNIHRYVELADSAYDLKLYFIGQKNRLDRYYNEKSIGFFDQEDDQIQDLIIQKIESFKTSGDSTSYSSSWQTLIASGISDLGLNLNSQNASTSSQPILNVSEKILINIKRLAKRSVRGYIDSDVVTLPSGETVTTFHTISQGDYVYHINVSEKMMYTQKKLNGTLSFYRLDYYNPKNLVEKTITAKGLGVVSFFKYDSLNRLTEELQSTAKETWNPETLTFDYPTVWNAKIPNTNTYVIQGKKEWSYTNDWTVDFDERRYAHPRFTTSPDVPSKTLKHYYLYDDLISRPSGNSTYSKYLDLQRDYYDISNTADQVVTKSFISRVEVLNRSKQVIKQVHFYYDNVMNMTMLQEDNESGVVFTSLANELYWLETYDISKKGNLSVPTYLDPIYYLDNDGSIIYDHETTAHFLDPERNLMAEPIYEVASLGNMLFDIASDYNDSIAFTNALSNQIMQLVEENLSTICLSQYFEKLTEDPETAFTVQYYLHRNEIDNDEELLSDYVAQVNADPSICTNVGVPVAQKKHYQFGDHEHIFWQMSHGAKFFSENEYNFWQTLSEVKESMDKYITERQMGEQYGIGVSGTGTYYQSYFIPSSRRRSGFDYSTAYFNPKSKSIVAVRDDYLDLYNSRKSDEYFFTNTIDRLKHCDFNKSIDPQWKDYCFGIKNISLLGFPLTDYDNTVDFFGSEGFKQPFLNGVIFKIPGILMDGWNDPYRLLYGKVYDLYQFKGGESSVGYPVTNPIYRIIENPARVYYQQHFANTDIWEWDQYSNVEILSFDESDKFNCNIYPDSKMRNVDYLYALSTGLMESAIIVGEGLWETMRLVGLLFIQVEFHTDHFNKEVMMMVDDMNQAAEDPNTPPMIQEALEIMNSSACWMKRSYYAGLSLGIIVAAIAEHKIEKKVFAGLKTEKVVDDLLDQDTVRIVNNLLPDERKRLERILDFIDNYDNFCLGNPLTLNPDNYDHLYASANTGDFEGVFVEPQEVGEGRAGLLYKRDWSGVFGQGIEGSGGENYQTGTQVRDFGKIGGVESNNTALRSEGGTGTTYSASGNQTFKSKSSDISFGTWLSKSNLLSDSRSGHSLLSNSVDANLWNGGKTLFRDKLFNDQGRLSGAYGNKIHLRQNNQTQNSFGDNSFTGNYTSNEIASLETVNCLFLRNQFEPEIQNSKSILKDTYNQIDNVLEGKLTADRLSPTFTSVRSQIDDILNHPSGMAMADYGTEALISRGGIVYADIKAVSGSNKLTRNVLSQSKRLEAIDFIRDIPLDNIDNTIDSLKNLGAIQESALSTLNNLPKPAKKNVLGLAALSNQLHYIDDDIVKALAKGADGGALDIFMADSSLGKMSYWDNLFDYAENSKISSKLARHEIVGEAADAMNWARKQGNGYEGYFKSALIDYDEGLLNMAYGYVYRDSLHGQHMVYDITSANPVTTAVTHTNPYIAAFEHLKPRYSLRPALPSPSNSFLYKLLNVSDNFSRYDFKADDVFIHTLKNLYPDEILGADDIVSVTGFSNAAENGLSNFIQGSNLTGGLPDGEFYLTFDPYKALGQERQKLVQLFTTKGKGIKVELANGTTKTLSKDAMLVYQQTGNGYGKLEHIALQPYWVSKDVLMNGGNLIRDKVLFNIPSFSPSIPLGRFASGAFSESIKPIYLPKNDSELFTLYQPQYRSLVNHYMFFNLISSKLYIHV